jgi:NMD protein affecting ribosome stability and mRNA decay
MANTEDWERAGGVYCPGCGQETVRLLNGLCPTCAREAAEETDAQIEDRAMRNYYRNEIRKGNINLSRMRQGLL